MPLVTVSDGARSVVRRIDHAVPLETLCAAALPVEYAGGWRIEPDGASIVLVTPTGSRHGAVAPGDALALGATTLSVSTEPGAAARLAPTERLPDDTRTRLVLALPGSRKVVLGTRALTLGKNPRCDVVLDDPTVSDTHCRLVPTQHGWEIHDAGSTNGTRVAGVRVRSAILTPGVTLVLGRTAILCINDPAGQPPRSPPPSGVLVGDSPGIEAVRQCVARYASSPYPVLVQGETGSGKEVVARMLHDRSGRAQGPFVAINAAAIAPDLVESELFGHEKGAFTGAVGRRRGVFEEAAGGTLFLDEVAELPLGQQAKLLRVLEAREVRRVGTEGAVRVDARVICATHRDLGARVARGAFRADLLYRIDMLRVLLPPLRARAEDVPVLARHLLARVAAEIGQAKTLDDAAVAALVAHDWPGNVRELYGVLCRAAVEAFGERIGVEHLCLAPVFSAATTAATAEAPPPGPPDARAKTPTAPPPAAALPLFATPPTDLRGPALQALIDACGGNLSRVARATGLARSTLRDRLRKA